MREGGIPVSATSTKTHNIKIRANLKSSRISSSMINSPGIFFFFLTQGDNLLTFKKNPASVENSPQRYPHKNNDILF